MEKEWIELGYEETEEKLQERDTQKFMMKNDEQTEEKEKKGRKQERKYKLRKIKRGRRKGGKG